jgi:NADPH-dependent curcumin reductase CurA
MLAGRLLTLKRHALSIDPYMRGRMNAAPSYAQPAAVGETMEGETIAEVVQSRDADWPTPIAHTTSEVRESGLKSRGWSSR